MPNDDSGATPGERERPVDVTRDLPVWSPRSMDPGARRGLPLGRILADMPDEFLREPIGVIEAELRRHYPVAG